MPSLPIDPLLPQLTKALSTSPAAVLTAPPGAGKTTRVPLHLLQTLKPRGLIVVLEPRRVAARACASYMAKTLGEPVGQTVGFQIRFESRISDRTKILVMTEGILGNRFLADPLLSDVACVILDEFHERSIHTDLALAFMRELLEVRKELRLVVMSATLDAGALSRFLFDCPVLCCENAAFPTLMEYAKSPDQRPMQARIASALRHLLSSDQDDGGDILVFLPGAPEIHKTARHLQDANLPGSPLLVPLYGAMKASEQDQVLNPCDQRRVVLATNIAETSLTIPNIKSVVDSGLHKFNRHDPGLGMDRLELGRISQQSATQRAGRAGRIAPGRVVRLWTQSEHLALPAAEEPEIRRVDLASALLQVVCFHPGDPGKFDFFERPQEAALEAALRLLRQLGALSGDDCRLTPKGQALARMPLHPRIGCLLESAAREGLLVEAAQVAALLSERDILRADGNDQSMEMPTVDSDLLWRLELMNERRPAPVPIDSAAFHQVHKVGDQLVRLGKRLWPAPSSNQPGSRSLDDWERLLLSGFPDRVCRRRSPGKPDGVMVGGRGVRLAPASGVRDAPFFLALSGDAGRRGAHSAILVRMASAISQAGLLHGLPELVRVEQGALFDPKRRAVIGCRRTFYLDLLVEEKTGVSVDPEVVSNELAHQAALHFQELFQPDPAARQLLARLLLARRIFPEESWPDVSQPSLSLLLPELCQGKQSFEDVARLDWKHALWRRLPFEKQKKLDRDLPERMPVPSGSQIKLDYLPILSEQASPVLAVRLQEVFGLMETPRIARGRVAVLMHLLAPNHRPVQVTLDLKSFWETGYQEVRKQLRARYPKHAWPEDPRSAPPQVGTRRKPRR